MLYDVAVIGAGPAGLYAADQAATAGLSVVVLEGRDRVGGRLLSVEAGSQRMDLGATWYWANEPLVNELIATEGLAHFAQHLSGDAMFQHDQGVERMQGNQIDAPSGRLVSGTQSIAEALARRLDIGVLHLNQTVDSIRVDAGVVTVRGTGGSWQTRHVIIAVPPATAVSHISFSAPLPDRIQALAAATPVWMGGIVKVVAQYDRPFWREVGLAGSAFSYTGPMRELHDMSGPDGDPAALFGFAQPGAGNRAPSRAEVLAQLSELFGPDAASPVKLVIHDWRSEALTSPANVDALTNYQTYGHPLFAEAVIDGRVHWASTETATTAPGHIEGALQAASRASAAVIRALTA